MNNLVKNNIFNKVKDVLKDVFKDDIKRMFWIGITGAYTTSAVVSYNTRDPYVGIYAGLVGGVIGMGISAFPIFTLIGIGIATSSFGSSYYSMKKSKIN